MSKAFKKDDDDDAVPLFARRAPLPEGVANYVTPFGLTALRSEQQALESELGEAATDPSLRAISKAKLAAIAQRIACAVLVDPSPQDHAVVRFGATVELLDAAGKSRRYAIVGVDEANASSGKIAFVAPLARALLGKRVGDVVLVRAPHGDDELEIVRIEYASMHT